MKLQKMILLGAIALSLHSNKLIAQGEKLQEKDSTNYLMVPTKQEDFQKLYQFAKKMDVVCTNYLAFLNNDSLHFTQAEDYAALYKETRSQFTSLIDELGHMDIPMGSDLGLEYSKVITAISMFNTLDHRRGPLTSSRNLSHGKLLIENARNNLADVKHLCGLYRNSYIFDYEQSRGENDNALSIAVTRPYPVKLILN